MQRKAIASQNESAEIKNLNEALFTAAEKDRLEEVDALIANGADVDPTWAGETPLLMAAKGGHLDVVNALLAKGGHINDTNEYGYGQTPLHLAAKGGHLDVVIALLTIGADIDKTNEYGQTPLHLAAQNGHLDVVNALLVKGADLYMANAHHMTPIDLAAKKGHLDVVNALLAKGAELNKAGKHGDTPLYAAAENGHLGVVKFLIEKGTDINAADEYCRTPLHLAAMRGYLDVVNALLEKGADFKKTDQKGRTPLHLAAEDGHLDVANALIEKGADFSLSEVHRGKLLCAAAAKGNLKTIEIMLQKGANIDAPNEKRQTPLYVAAENSQFDVVKVLIAQGADLNKAFPSNNRQGSMSRASYAKTWCQKAETHQQLGQIKEAIDAFNIAIKLGDRNALTKKLELLLTSEHEKAAPQNIPGNIGNPFYWYQAKDINTLLKKTIVDKDVHIIDSQFPLITSRDSQNHEIAFKNSLKIAFDFSAEKKLTLIPINLTQTNFFDFTTVQYQDGFQWVLLVVSQEVKTEVINNEHYERRSININYINPLGHGGSNQKDVSFNLDQAQVETWSPISSLVQQAINEAGLNKLSINSNGVVSVSIKVKVSGLIQQQKEYDSGPLLIANAITEVHKATLAKPNILSLRKEHAQLANAKGQDQATLSLVKHQANAPISQSLVVSNEAFDERLLNLLKKEGAQIDLLGKHIADLTRLVGQFPLYEATLIPLHNMLKRLLPASHFIVDQPWPNNNNNPLPVEHLAFKEINLLIRKLQDMIDQLSPYPQYKAIVQKLAIIKAGYQDSIAAENQIALFTKKAQLWSDRLADPYLIEADFARRLLCIDDQQKVVKINKDGNRAVHPEGGLFFKPNPIRDFNKPACEFAIVSLHALLTEKAYLAAPTSLFKIQHVTTKKGMYENICQVGYGLGDMSLKDMLLVITMLEDFSKRLTANKRLTILTSLINDTFVAATTRLNEEQLFSYWIDFLETISPENRPSNFRSLDKSSSKLKNFWNETINTFGLAGVKQLMDLLERCPELMLEQTMNDLAHYITAMNNITQLWPNRTAEEIIETFPTWLAQGDKDHFGRIFIANLLTNPTDGKPDNYRIHLLKNNLGQSVGWQIQSIDNDNALAPEVLFYKNGSHDPSVLCLPYLIKPMMKEKVHPTVRKMIMSQSAKHWILDWLYALYHQETRYQSLLQQGVLNKQDLVGAEVDEVKLDIPFRFAPGIITDIYMKLLTLQKILAKEPEVTYDRLLRLVLPIISQYYTAIQKQYFRPIPAANAVHSKNMSIETLLAEQLNQPLSEIDGRTLSDVLQAFTRTANQVTEIDCTQTIMQTLEELLTHINLAAFEPNIAYDVLKSIARFTSLPSMRLCVDEKTQTDWLIRATAEGQVDTVRLLLSSGVNINATNGITPLHQFARVFEQTNSDEDIVNMAKLLLQSAGIDVHKEDSIGLSPLFYLIKGAKRYPEKTELILKIWVKQGFPLNMTCVFDEDYRPHNESQARNKAGKKEIKVRKSILDHCVDRDNVNGFKLLVKYGAYQITDFNKVLNFLKANNLEETKQILEQRNSQFQFRTSLLTLTTEKEAEQNSVPIAGAFSGQRFIPPDIAILIFDKSGHLLDAKSQSKPATATNNTFASDTMEPPSLIAPHSDKPEVHRYKDGRHRAVRVTWKGQSLVFKEEPELPGVEYAVTSLSQLLIGHGAPESELFVVQDAQGQPYSLIITQYVDGPNCADILTRTKTSSSLPEQDAKAVFAQLDPKRLSEYLLFNFLINPEDGKPDNYILHPFINEFGKQVYHFVGVDNDHAFTKPVVIENKQRKLKLKTILFCLDAMRQPLHPEAVAAFLKHDPKELLQAWLSNLMVQQEKYNILFVNNKKNINDNAIAYHKISFRPEIIASMFDKFEQIQACLRENPTTTPLALLRKVMLLAGICYEEAFTTIPATPAMRFYVIAKDHYNLANEQYHTLTTRNQVIESMDVPLAEVKQKDYLPEEALNELKLVSEESKRVSHVITLCEEGKYVQKPMMQFFTNNLVLSPVYDLKLDSTKVAVLAKIKWQKLPLDKQKSLLLSFSFTGNAALDLTIKGCDALTKDALSALLKTAGPSLRSLTIDDCNNLTAADLIKIAKECPLLEKLTLIKFKDALIAAPALIGSPNPIEFPSLRRLIIKESPTVQLLQLNAKNLKDLRIHNCSELREIQLVKPEHLQKLTLTACQKINPEPVMTLINAVKRFAYLKLDSTLNVLKPELSKIIARDSLWTQNNLSFLTEKDTLTLDRIPSDTEFNKAIIYITQNLSAIHLENGSFSHETILMLMHTLQHLQIIEDNNPDAVEGQPKRRVIKFPIRELLKEKGEVVLLDGNLHFKWQGEASVAAEIMNNCQTWLNVWGLDSTIVKQKDGTFVLTFAEERSAYLAMELLVYSHLIDKSSKNISNDNALVLPGHAAVTGDKLYKNDNRFFSGPQGNDNKQPEEKKDDRDLEEIIPIKYGKQEM